MKNPLNLYYFRACALCRADGADHERHHAMNSGPLWRFDAQLALVNAETMYDTMCVIQNSELRPRRSDSTFPTLGLKIGYAARSNERALQRLLAKQSPNVVEIDHSYNEAVLDVEVLRLTDGEQLQV
jgi:hypothetical protein